MKSPANGRSQEVASSLQHPVAGSLKPIDVRQRTKPSGTDAAGNGDWDGV